MKKSTARRSSSRSPIFFPTPAAFRRWLQANHATASEVWVGYYRKETGEPSPTWQESVDEVLCFGWIDGLRKKLDDRRYMQRFTPRKSNRWSAINIARAKALIRDKRMRPAGLAAFEARDKARSGYSAASLRVEALSPALERTFKANAAAWTFFQAQPPGYRRNSIGMVMAAMQQATRVRRLDVLIRVSAAGRRLDMLRPLTKQGV